jgi:hypothetical protein
MFFVIYEDLYMGDSMKFKFLMAVVAFGVAIGFVANAESYFVEKAKVTNGGQTNAETATTLINDRLKSLEGMTMADSASAADFVLRPKVTRLGKAYVISIEKIKSGKRVSMTEGKAMTIEDLDKAVDKATIVAVNGAPRGAPLPQGLGEGPREGLQRGPPEGPVGKSRPLPESGDDPVPPPPPPSPGM